jgi:hypothetical protein
MELGAFSVSLAVKDIGLVITLISAAVLRRRPRAQAAQSPLPAS